MQVCVVRVPNRAVTSRNASRLSRIRDVAIGTLTLAPLGRKQVVDHRILRTRARRGANHRNLLGRAALDGNASLVRTLPRHKVIGVTDDIFCRRSIGRHADLSAIEKGTQSVLVPCCSRSASLINARAQLMINVSSALLNKILKSVGTTGCANGRAVCLLL